MEFTFKSYEHLISDLLQNGYKIASYHNCDEYKKCAILRHDIDLDVEKALDFAKLERSLGVATSTYFFLLTSDFYNISSPKNRATINKIADMGFEIGLHFDETAYSEKYDIVSSIHEEARRMGDILCLNIKCVSMHRPSEKFLSADYNLNGIVNSYSKKFFNDYKYVSDSRMHWREDIFDIIDSEDFQKLHILTHPFWYGEEAETMEDIIKRFIVSSKGERYDTLNDNFRDLGTVLKREHIL